MIFKEKPLKNKSLVDWQQEEKVQRLFEETIKDLQEKEPPRANIQTLIKTNFIKKIGLDIVNEFFGLIGSTEHIGLIGST
jgi:hypothetical protein